MGTFAEQIMAKYKALLQTAAGCGVGVPTGDNSGRASSRRVRPRVGGYGAWQALMMKPPDFSSRSSSRMPWVWASSSNWLKDRNP